MASEKKKLPLFNTGKTTGSEKKTIKKETSIAEADTRVTAAVFHSSDTNRPTASNKGQIKKGITKFFKKKSKEQGKKTSKKANIVVDQQMESNDESKPFGTKETQPLAQETNKELVQKEDSLEIVDGDLNRYKAAAKIQAVFRGHNQRRKYLQKRQNVIKVEALARGFLARKHVAGMKAVPAKVASREESTTKIVGPAQSENLITF